MPSPDLSTEFCGMKMPLPYMNASGTLSFADALSELQDYFGAVVIKSTGPVEKAGNQTPTTTQPSKETYLNSMGLPNPGCSEVRDELSAVYPLAVPLIASEFGNSPEELANVVSMLDAFCDAHEVNISCPNIRQGEKTGMLIGKDPVLAKEYIAAARSKTKKPLWAKLTPATYIFEPKLNIQIAQACVDAGADALVDINTIPGGMHINVYAKRPVLSAKYGGLSGRAIKPIGIGCIYSLFEEFGDDVPLIGVGGITEPEDIVEYVLAGASAVQVGTALKDRGINGIPDFSKYLKSGVEDMLEKLGAGSLMELRGAAHE